MKLPFLSIKILFFWAVIATLSCNTPAGRAAEAITETPAGKKLIKDVAKGVEESSVGKKVGEIFEGFKPKKPTLPTNHLLPRLRYANLFFNVVDAEGRVINVIDPSVQSELSQTIMRRDEIIQVLFDLQTKVDESTSNADRQEAFLEAYNKVNASIKSGLWLVGGVVIYSKKCAGQGYYITLS